MNSLVQPIGLVDYNYVFKEVHLTSTFLKEILEAVYRRCIDVLLGKIIPYDVLLGNIIPSIYNPVICQFSEILFTLNKLKKYKGELPNLLFHYENTHTRNVYSV